MIAIAGKESAEGTPRRIRETSPENWPADQDPEGISEQATEMVGAHPFVAVATAAAVGALVGWIVKRKLLA